MPAIIPFDFETCAVRVVMQDGEPVFVAADVCRALEIGKYRDAVSRLDADEGCPVIVDMVEESASAVEFWTKDIIERVQK